MKASTFFQPGKKILWLAGALLVLAGTAVFAHGEKESERHEEKRDYPTVKQNPTGGFIGPVVTVSEVSTLTNDDPVRLQGSIVQALKDNRYEFQDGTGTINVKIDRKAWNGFMANSGDILDITGKVDRFLSRREVDVKFIQIIQPVQPEQSQITDTPEQS